MLFQGNFPDPFKVPAALTASNDVTLMGLTDTIVRAFITV